MMASLRYVSIITSAITHSPSCLRYFEPLSTNPSTAQPTTNSFFLKVGGKTLFHASLIYPRSGICSPIGASMIFYPAMSAVGTWFHKNRALALGVMASGSSLGGVIFPIMIKKLVAEVGFAWSMRIAAFFILALLIYSNLTLRSRLPPTRKPWSLKEFLSPFRERTYSLVVVASFFFFFGMFLPFTYIVLEAEYYGMSANLAGYLVSILNAGQSKGSFLLFSKGKLKGQFLTESRQNSLHLRPHNPRLRRRPHRPLQHHDCDRVPQRNPRARPLDFRSG